MKRQDKIERLRAMASKRNSIYPNANDKFHRAGLLEMTIQYSHPIYKSMFHQNIGLKTNNETIDGNTFKQSLI